MITVKPSGEVAFRIYLPHAAKVELHGSFTDWSRGALALVRQFPGWWHLGVEVPPGEHTFYYLIDNAIRVPDFAAHGMMMDKSGSWVSKITIGPAVVVESKARRQTA